MRLLVASDSHRDFDHLNRAVLSQHSAEVIIHCGDGAAEAEDIRMLYPEKMVVSVKGNCDFSSALNTEETIMISNKRIFITHGHVYSVKAGLTGLIAKGNEENADIICFGHTHNSLAEYKDGIYLLNPGSLKGYGATYGIIDITDAGIFTNIINIKY